MNKGALILTIISAVLMILSLLVAVISIVLAVTSEGHISGDEAAPFTIIGFLCCSFSFLGVVGGVIWLIVARSKK